MKRFMAILLAGMLSLSAAVPSFAAVATNAGKWAKPSIEFAYQQGLLTEADLQKAKSPMTRKDFCKMVMRFLNVITGKEWKAAGKTPFTDCDDADVTAAYELGIIGGTGSGKTSLMSLIPRLYEAQEGTVSVGGRPVADYTMEHLRESVSVVLQKNTLFSGTIRENLLWGDPNATEDQLWTACRAACADEFLERMPDGLDTDLGQGGVNVSGGQKQRLCIARAILKKPKVLILDDSTSAVDTATDAKIRQAFRQDLPGTTKLIVAQRVTSVMDADLILVMDDGAVAAQGTHEELMKTCEIYREVYESQQEGVSIGG